MGNLQRLGQQVLAEFMGCQISLLKDPRFIEKTLIAAAEKAGATVVTSSFHHFNPLGVSGVVVLKESHLAIHTWPEFGYASIDLFTCGSQVQPKEALLFLKEELQAQDWWVQEISRGPINTLQKSIDFNDHLCHL